MSRPRPRAAAVQMAPAARAAYLQGTVIEQEEGAMGAVSTTQQQPATTSTDTMRAAVFEGPGQIKLRERALPPCGPTDAIVRVSMTTICGTDVHILRGEYPVAPGRIVGHEPVGVIHALGSAVHGYAVGDRVLVGAITPCGSCFFCQNGDGAQCSGHEDRWEMIGGWRLGNSADGVQADYFRVPYAQANLAAIPDDLSDEQCVLLADIASTGISAAETANVRIGQTVAVFAQGPIGLCATAGARLKGASMIIGVDAIEKRLLLSREMGAGEVVDFTQEDPVAAIKRLTEGRGVDVAIEALGKPETFQWCLEATRPGGVVSSLGVYGGKLEIPVEPFIYGIGDKKILSTLCPGGKERMNTLMRLVRTGRLDLSKLISHRFRLDQIEEAYDLFANQRDGVVKVAITP
jgi:alcohol dehydrogenase